MTHLCMRYCRLRKILPRHAVDWDQRCSRW